MNPIIVKLAYLVSAVLFILGLKYMAHPRTAVRGNRLASIGMLVAIIATLGNGSAIAGYWLIFVGMVVGGVAGVYLAKTVEMTSMPELVALFNGLGGGASVLVAGGELLRMEHGTTDSLIAAAVSGVIGTITFWGSIVAYGKLKELPSLKKPIRLPYHQWINLGLVVLILLFATMCVTGSGRFDWYVFMALVASLLGILLVVPIGGADMPVVIALLNSYSGLAASATGFVINNNVLIISGALVGASGLILTQIMCKAMNRSLANVLFGGIEASSTGSDNADDEVYAAVRRTSADDVAMILDTAQRVVFVPGYGMAVAQAQHAVCDLADALKKRETKVEYAIHPVAGRMPGHMNVLLAEADVPYDELLEMDKINPSMDTVDVAIVIGANDVVNPLSRQADSAIAGMPIIDVDKARTVVVIKRSLSPGFAGLHNPLFAADNTLMLFGDGKQAVLDIISAVQEL